MAPKCHEQRLLLRRYLSHSESSSDAKVFFALAVHANNKLVENLNDRKFWEIISEPSIVFAQHSTALSHLVHLFVRL